MVYILFFALIYLLITSLVLARNRFQFKALKNQSSTIIKNHPKVSICIPARNEELSIGRCINSCLQQNYPNFEVLVLDDESTDNTPFILRELKKGNNRLSVLNGKPKPNNWLGKPWACHQLSKQSNGEYLVFLDADVWLEPDVIQKTVAQLKQVDMVTVWPHQVVITFWEKLIIPTVYFTLFSLLPAVYVERPPRWMPHFFRKRFNPLFVAANGQFLAFRRVHYCAVGGHEAIKQEVVDDMALAKNMKEKGLNLRMLIGNNQIYCRMYTSSYEIWSGFRKNFLHGFPNAFVFSIMGTLHFLVFLLPIFALIAGITTDKWFLSVLAATIISVFTIQKVVVQQWLGLSLKFALLHVLAVSWFQVLGLVCLADKALNIKPKWKDRPI